MGILKRFRKEEEKKTQKEVKTELEMLCGDDKETFEALRKIMFLNPRKAGIPMKEAIKNAEESEKSGDLIRAENWYKIAGGLAIANGDVQKVKQCFSKCEQLFPNKHYKILEIPEKAVQKAQEYYKKYLKE